MPSKGARSARRSALRNPWGSRRNMTRADSSAWVRTASNGRADARCWLTTIGSATARKASSPMVGSLLRRSTSRRRLLAQKSTWGGSGRLHSRFPILKSWLSWLSLMVVSVRSALPSLCYCLILLCL